MIQSLRIPAGVDYVNRLQPVDSDGRPVFTPFESVGRQVFVKASVLFRQ
ncbi:MAG: hypothetical protein AB7O93_11785 [Vicinamibacterales bacterium]